MDITYGLPCAREKSSYFSDKGYSIRMHSYAQVVNNEVTPCYTIIRMLLHRLKEAVVLHRAIFVQCINIRIPKIIHWFIV